MDSAKTLSLLPAQRRRRFLEPSPYESDEGNLIRREPGKIPAAERAGVPRLTAMEAIRAKCLDCAHGVTEVRKCVQSDCPLWPLQMGQYPKGHVEAAMPATP